MDTLEPQATFSELALEGLKAYLSGVYPAMSRQEAWDARLQDQKAGIPARNFEDLLRDEVLKREIDEMVNRPEPLVTATSSEAQKVGLDPTQPYHPLFNRSQEDVDHERDFLLEDARKRERQRYAAYWDETIRRIKAGEFRSRRALAEYYGRSAGWGQDLVKLMVKHEVFTPAELDTLLTGDQRAQRCQRRHTTQDTRSNNEVSLDNLKTMDRSAWEAVCHEVKPLPLTVDMLVSFIKSRRFNSLAGVSAFLGKHVRYGQAFRTFLERERIMSAFEFDGYLTRARGRLHKSQQPEIRATGVPRASRKSSRVASSATATQYSF